MSENTVFFANGDFLNQIQMIWAPGFVGEIYANFLLLR